MFTSELNFYIVLKGFSPIFRAATAALVEKQSHEMMELIQERRSEYMAESSLYIDGEEAPPYPARAPPPHPPLVSKFHIYTDPVEFSEVDKIAISVSVQYGFFLI